MNNLLKLKHWQLFGLFISIPLTIRIINTTIFKIPEEILDYIIPVMLILLMLIYFGWTYSVGTNLRSKIPETVKMNFKLFKTFQFFTIIFIPIFGIVTYLLMNFSPGGKPNENIITVLGLLIGLTPFCILYCIYFIAKTIRLVELQRPISLKDYIIDFLLILFFPIGVWIIQPKLNKISAN
jgi:hypothetical protein